MDLRPPIPPNHSYNNHKTTNNNEQDDDTITDQYKYAYFIPILSRMYVASQSLQLGTESRFTSLVLFHRYIAHFYGLTHNDTPDTTEPSVLPPWSKRRRRGNGKHNHQAEQKHLGKVAAACLFLGCKVMEEPRRIRDVINLSRMLGFENYGYGFEETDNGMDGACIDRRSSNGGDGQLHPNRHQEENQDRDQNPNQKQNQKNQQQRNKRIKIHQAPNPPDLDEFYWEEKERIVSTEQSVLRLIQFDVCVGQPHRLLVIVFEDYLVASDHSSIPSESENNDARTRGVLKSAWKKLNDALFYPPALICGCMELACAALDLSLEEEEKGSEEGRLDTHSNIGVHNNSGWKEVVGADQLRLKHAKEKLTEASDLLLSFGCNSTNDS